MLKYKQITVHRAHKQRGVGMVEVLVAAFMLAVGLLGVAGLQAHGMRANHTAALREIAVLKTVAMLERMRANPAAVAAAAYVSGTSDMGDNAVICADTSAAPGVPCTANQLARHDIFQWKNELSQVLPGASASIAVDTVSAAPVVISQVTINWAERGDNHNYVTQMRLWP